MQHKPSAAHGLAAPPLTLLRMDVTTDQASRADSLAACSTIPSRIDLVSGMHAKYERGVSKLRH